METDTLLEYRIFWSCSIGIMIGLDSNVFLLEVGVLAVYSPLGSTLIMCIELDYVLSLFPGISHDRILFTSNFVAKEEYERAFQVGNLCLLPANSCSFCDCYCQTDCRLVGQE